MTDRILSISRKSFSDVVKLRRELHRYPELAFQEIDTGKIIAHELEKLRIGVKKGIGKTGLVGILIGAAVSIHSSKFKIDEKGLMYGAALLAFLTIEYLNVRPKGIH
jgi:hypothetical protein